MRFDTDLMPYLPEWFRAIADYKELCLTEGQCFEALAAEINAVADNFFFQTMDASAVAQWEQIFNILPDLAAETLAFRRERLLNRISSRPPYTLSFLYQKLDELVGKGQWEVEVDYPNYTLYISTSAKNQSYYGELMYTIGTIKPAHIVFVNSPYVQAGLALQETVGLSESRYNYRLGSWQLGALPFGESMDKGVIKMPDIPSIQPQLLEDTAAFVADDVASARINGTLTIDTLTKTVNGSTATIRYPVHFDDGQPITKIELLDAKGRALTSSTVYVPVGENTVLRHVIPVKEGT